MASLAQTLHKSGVIVISNFACTIFGKIECTEIGNMQCT